MTHTQLHLSVSVLLVLLYNTTFFRHILTVYPLIADNIGCLLSLVLGFGTLFMLLFALFCWQRATKVVLMFFCIIASVTAYFMNTYDVLIDYNMLKNVMQTNLHEAFDLLSLKLCLYIVMLGIVPSVLLYKIPIKPMPLKKAILNKMLVIAVCLLATLGQFFLLSKFYMSFFREQKAVYYYANPVYPFCAVVEYVRKVTFASAKTAVQALGTDAHPAANKSNRKLIILVVGEAARADHFSLNGYQRETNPLLRQDGAISFTNMYSSGTATVFSVPRMFSVYPRDRYTDKEGEGTENLLDVLQHAGTHVLWRDNNSDSKGVALRVPYQDYKNADKNPICTPEECRDEGMLAGLQDYIDTQEGDILIVLHQMGNHGPAYYKRYPSEFERFTPVCTTNQLNECSKEEISNAYDNALLYTDYFLHQAITLLHKNTPQFATALLYWSDHGQSLGEYGLYLHGMPYAIAPDAQKHIGGVFWFSDNFAVDQAALRARTEESFSHDNLFHTVLGLFEIETNVYKKELDMVYSPK